MKITEVYTKQRKKLTFEIDKSFMYMHVYCYVF